MTRIAPSTVRQRVCVYTVSTVYEYSCTDYMYCSITNSTQYRYYSGQRAGQLYRTMYYAAYCV